MSIAIFIVIGGCKTQQAQKAISAEQLNQKVVAKLGDTANHINNQNNSYMLCWTEEEGSGTLVIKYGVWVIETGELLYANTAIRGSVAWLDNNALLVKDYPGIMDGEKQNTKFKIDLKTKIKTPINDKEDF